MAVLKVKARKVIEFFLPMVERELISPFLVTRVAGDNFKGALGDTVTLRIPGLKAVARDYNFRGRTAPIVLDDISGGAAVPIKIDTHVYSATGLEDEHMTLDEINFATEVLAPQVAAVTDRLETKTVAGIRASAAAAKHQLTFDAGDDPYLVTLEAKRLMDSEKVAPAGGRVFLVGSDIAAQWLASDRLSRYDSVGQDGTPALREATIGRLAGAPVVEHPGLNPGEGFYFHKSGLVTANLAPVVPQGVVQGRTGITRNGFATRWIQDYDPQYLRDRSVVSSFFGYNDIRDERNADGSWKFEQGDMTDEEFEVQGIDPALLPAAGTARKNVRMVRLTGGTGPVFTPTP